MSEPERFEDRLLAELTALVEQQPAEPAITVMRRRRRRPVLLAGVAAVITAAAIVVLPGVLRGGHGTPSAYAVEKRPGGSISFTVSGLIHDTNTVQSDLSAAGAGPVRVISAESYRGRCHDSDRNAPMPVGLVSATSPDSFLIDPTRLPAGQVLIAAVPTRTGAPARVSLSLSRDGTPPCRR
jgi:hypothetical protein